MKDQELIVKQITALLSEYERARISSPYADIGALASTEEENRISTRLSAAIHRFAPPGSAYLAEFRLPGLPSYKTLAGILTALRDDYAAGYLQTVQELIHADLFADFLEQAEYLLKEGFKDPAAVLAGGVLEEHLRKLCEKNDIKTHMPNDKPKNASALNDELAGEGAYNKLEQKSVTAWLDLRNNAAHGKYDQYDKNQVVNMIQGVRDFITRNPA